MAILDSTNVYILAGGLGTRLSHVTANYPKPMMKVGNYPFLEWQIKWLKKQGFRDIVLLVGHLKEKIIEYFGNGDKFGVRINYSIEKKLLGTGGALIKALLDYPSKYFLVLNGDTYFDINLVWFLDYFYRNSNSNSIYLALKFLTDANRYGTIKLSADFSIKDFREKVNFPYHGYINGGIYAGSSSVFRKYKVKRKSLEYEIFPEFISGKNLFGIPFGDKFIDIGIPEDLKKADKLIEQWFAGTKKKALFICMDMENIFPNSIELTTKGSKISAKNDIPELIKLANDKNYKVIIISSQPKFYKENKFKENGKKWENPITFCIDDRKFRIDDLTYYPYETPKKILSKLHTDIVLDAIDKHFISGTDSILIDDNENDFAKLPYLKSYCFKSINKKPNISKSEEHRKIYEILNHKLKGSDQ